MLSFFCPSPPVAASSVGSMSTSGVASFDACCDLSFSSAVGGGWGVCGFEVGLGLLRIGVTVLFQKKRASGHQFLSPNGILGKS
jgi:hypothetical protein